METEKWPRDVAARRSRVALRRDISGPGEAEWIRMTPLTVAWQIGSLLSLIHPRASLSSRETEMMHWGRKQVEAVSQVTSLDCPLHVIKMRGSELLFTHLLTQQTSIKQLFYTRSWEKAMSCPWVTVSNSLTRIIDFFVSVCGLPHQQDGRVLPWGYILLSLTTGPNTIPGTYHALNIGVMNMLLFHYKLY